MCHWHTAGSLGWPFPVLKYKYIFQIKYTEAILSNSTWKLLWFEITKMLIAVVKNQFIVSFIIIFGTLSFPIWVRIHPWKGEVTCWDLHNITSICNVFMVVSMWPGHSRLWKQAIWSHTWTIYQKVFEFSEMLRQKISWVTPSYCFFLRKTHILYVYKCLIHMHDV